MDDGEVKCSNYSLHAPNPTLNEYMLPREPWGLKAGLYDVVGGSDVAHWNLIVVDLGDVVGEGIAGNDELLSVEYVLVLLEDIAHIHVHILIARFFNFGHAPSHWSTLHQDFEYLRGLMHVALTQTSFDFNDVTQWFNLFPQLQVLF